MADTPDSQYTDPFTGIPTDWRSRIQQVTSSADPLPSSGENGSDNGTGHTKNPRIRRIAPLTETRQVSTEGTVDSAPKLIIPTIDTALPEPPPQIIYRGIVAAFDYVKKLRLPQALPSEPRGRWQILPRRQVAPKTQEPTHLTDAEPFEAYQLYVNTLVDAGDEIPLADMQRYKATLITLLLIGNSRLQNTKLAPEQIITVQILNNWEVTGNAIRRLLETDYSQLLTMIRT